MLNLQFFLTKRDILVFKKMLAKTLAKSFFYLFTISNELDIQIFSYINIINKAMTFIFFKAKLFLKSVSKFDKGVKRYQ